VAAGSITIDGRKIPFQQGDTIIAAAHRAGIDIPHYCYHPGLSAPSNCRICLVEIAPPPGRPPMLLSILRWDAERQDYVPAKKPKLMPACQMRCADGMEVKSDTSEHVAEARAAIQELILLNHPVDCPICDQAGECHLQDYWLLYQRTGKRMHQELVHKPKAVSFGPTIVYDGERCISCTRCIRICKEIARDPVLDLRQRGNLNEITVAPGRRLDHDYTLMTAHTCPVGALTAKHFRFKARAWFLRSGRTICQGCATGCNAFLDYDPRDNTPYRFRPRENEQVNRHWMCDEGMLSYPAAHEDRLLTPLIGGDDATLSEALDAAKRQLKGHAADPSRVAVVLSATHSSEDNFALATLAGTFIGTREIYLARRPYGRGDDILMSADKNPNVAGVTQVTEKLGLGEPRPLAALLDAISEGRHDYVITLGATVDQDDGETKAALARLKGSVAIASHYGTLPRGSHIALPACSWAEVRGTYVNRQGLAQQTEPVLAPRGAARPGWELCAQLGRALGYDLDWTQQGQVEEAMSTPPPSPPEAAAEPSQASEAAP